MAEPAPTPLDELTDRLNLELDSAQAELRQITNTVNQSRAEVDKLTQRNTAAALQLRQVQNNLENTSRADIKSAYDAVQETQQRLFAMRNQIEKVQSEQAGLERLVSFLQETLQVLGDLKPGARGTSAGADGKPIIVRVIEAQEAERQKLSRQIHDGPAQALSNFILQTEIAMRLFDVDPDRARNELATMKTAAATTFQKVRDFIFDLRPMMLDDLGLIPTVRRYVDTFKEKSGIQTTLNVTGAIEQRLEQVREVMVFRGLQELLGNIRSHAQASQVRIDVDIDQERVRLVVEDNGKGFDVEAALKGPQRTIGLSAIEERVDLLGGRLQVQSEVGQGTRVEMEVPAVLA